MKKKLSGYLKAKKKYLKYIRSQETVGEKFINIDEQFNNFYIPLIKIIHNDHIKFKQTRIIGLSGPQGSGKSTIAEILKILLQEIYNLKVVIFSIDDFYKSLREREKMSKKISSLFLTRGVPGSHDTKILRRCLLNLKKKKI